MKILTRLATLYAITVWALPIPLVAPISTAGSSQDPSYFAILPSAVWFVQWTETQGTLSGQFQRVYVTDDNPLLVQSDNTPFTGVRNGSDLSLKMGAFFSYETWTGIVRGSTLSLAIPDRSGLLATVVLKAGTAEDYNKAALALRARVAQQASAVERERQRLTMIDAKRQAVTGADEAVISALDNLSDTVKQLTDHSKPSNFQPLLESYADHWTKMQADYETLRVRAAKIPFDCDQLSLVKDVLSTLEDDLSSIRDDDSSFEDARNSIVDDLSEVTKGISRARTVMEQLQSAILANAPKPPQGAIVYLENHSDGIAVFFLDGKLICTVLSGAGCTIVLQGSHQLSASTSDALTSDVYRTPQTTLVIQEGKIYRYLACGAMGAPGENCGLFVVSTPDLIGAALFKANQQSQASRRILDGVNEQKNQHNRNAERLLEEARNFVSDLTCNP